MVKQMLRYEMKKIFSRPVNKILIIALIAISLTAGFLAVRDVWYITEDGHISGMKAANQLKEAKEEWSGLLTEDVLRKAVEANRVLNANVPEDDIDAQDEAFRKKQGFADIRDMISLAFSEFSNYDYYRADSVSSEEVSDFYNRRISNLKDWLDAGGGDFSETERKFLVGQFEETHTPFYYEYADGWMALLDSQYMPILTIIVTVIIGFLVSGIFSGEFRFRADSIFFSSKLGRSRAVFAKIGAGVFTVTIVYWGAILLYSAVVLCSLGFGGSACEVQIDTWRSIYNLTFLQDYFLTVIGGYIGCLFISALAMLVSALSRSMAIAVTIPFVLSCIPMFLGRISFLERIMALFPDQLLQISMNLDNMKLYEIGGKVMGHISVIVPLYLVLLVIVIPVLYYIYKMTEVK